MIADNAPLKFGMVDKPKGTRGFHENPPAPKVRKFVTSKRMKTSTPVIVHFSGSAVIDIPEQEGDVLAIADDIFRSNPALYWDTLDTSVSIVG